eukprot:265919_1
MSLFTPFQEHYPNIPGEDFNGYWSPRTASFNWCEIDYSVTYYVAEFWNSISNIMYLLCSIHLMIQYNEMRKHIKLNPWISNRYKTINVYLMYLNFACLAAIGFGSTAYHLTLKWYGQKLDQIAEISTVETLLFITIIFQYLSSVNFLIETVRIIFICVYIIIALLIMFFAKYYFGSFIVVTMAFVYIRGQYIAYKYSHAQHLQINLYRIIFLFVLAGICWYIDRYYCEIIQLKYKYFYGHALWHVLTALAFHQIGVTIILLHLTNNNKLKHVKTYSFCKLIYHISFYEQQRLFIYKL